jgi:hypothetical protein
VGGSGGGAHVVDLPGGLGRFPEDDLESVEAGDGFAPGGAALGGVVPEGPGEGALGKLLLEHFEVTHGHALVDRGVVQAEGDAGLAQTGRAVTAGNLGQKVEAASVDVDAGHGRIRKVRDGVCASMHEPCIRVRLWCICLPYGALTLWLRRQCPSAFWLLTLQGIGLHEFPECRSAGSVVAGVFRVVHRSSIEGRYYFIDVVLLALSYQGFSEIVHHSSIVSLWDTPW